MAEFSTTVKMNILISRFYIWLYNSTTRLSYWRFATQWNLLCWKYKIHVFCFGYKQQNSRIHEHVIFNKTTKIDTHEEKYFHSIPFLTWPLVHNSLGKHLAFLTSGTSLGTTHPDICHKHYKNLLF